MPLGDPFPWLTSYKVYWSQLPALVSLEAACDKLTQVFVKSMLWPAVLSSPQADLQNKWNLAVHCKAVPTYHWKNFGHRKTQGLLQDTRMALLFYLQRVSQGHIKKTLQMGSCFLNRLFQHHVSKEELMMDSSVYSQSPWRLKWAEDKGIIFIFDHVNVTGYICNNPLKSSCRYIESYLTMSFQDIL